MDEERKHLWLVPPWGDCIITSQVLDFRDGHISLGVAEYQRRPTLQVIEGLGNFPYIDTSGDARPSIIGNLIEDCPKGLIFMWRLI